MNKESGEPILLYDMDNGMGSSFDCGQLSNRVRGIVIKLKVERVQMEHKTVICHEVI